MSVNRPLCACPHAREWLRVARARHAIALLFLLLLILVNGPARAQSSSGTLTGHVFDQSGAVVPGAQITVVNVDSAFERKAETDRNGSFSMPFVPPGRYVVAAQKDGFATSELRDVILNVNDQLAVSVTLAVRSAEETTTVVAQATRASVAAGTGTVVDRQFIENIPLNGRSLHALMQLVPGVVLTPNIGNAANGAQFSVSGQRSNANSYQVDGVSVNTGLGVTAGALSGPTAVGQSAGTNILGGTSSLASLDAVQEFRIETSNFAPEYGRSPGGHIALVTRSGTNALRGSASEYFRHEAMNANDWFVNNKSQPRPRMRQHLFSGTLGGPLRADRAFFFGSYEGLYLEQPQATTVTVPNPALRARTPAALKPYLDAMPLPNGRGLTNDMSEFAASYSEPSTAHSAALRVDAILAHGMTGFARLSHAPSRRESRVLTLSTIQSARMQNDYVTIGGTWLPNSRVSVDARINFSRNRSVLNQHFDAYGGAVRPDPSSVFPSGRGPSNASTRFTLTPSGFALGAFGDDTQRQFNVTGTAAWTARGHQMKFGVDYLRLTPSLAAVPSETLVFSTVSQLLESRAAFYTSNNAAPAAREAVISSLSLYAQDAWQLARRWTVTYGVRFERVPSPRESTGQQPPTVIGLVNDSVVEPRLAPSGTPLWRARFGETAFRLGVAHLLSTRPGWETTVRGGGGLFYDLGLGVAAYAFRDAFPYTATRTTLNVPIPLSEDVRTPPALGVSPPRALYLFDPDLRLPYTRQTHVAWEQGVAGTGIFTIGYVGAFGRRLITQQAYLQPLAEWPTANTRLLVQRNSGRSRYHALQMQYQRRLHRGVQALASYTLSRSSDNGSSDFSLLPPNGSSTLSALQWGPTDFDARHVFTIGVTIETPLTREGFLGALSSGWGVDAMFRAQSGFPGTPTTSSDVAQLFGFTQRADIVPGEPMSIHDSGTPGGRRVNPAAFVSPPDTTRQGTASRNSVRMFGVSQVDLALRREIGRWRGIRFQFKGEVFNLLNQPAFGPFVMELGPQFGTVQNSLNVSLGGLNPLYQMGGSRSAQLSLRTLF